jgi:DNA-binding XRE family transcriptional regulator
MSGIESPEKGEYAVNHPVLDGSIVEPPGLLGGFVAGKPTLTEARKRAVLSMYELAKKAGVAASTILDIERGARPQMRTIRKLSAALDVAPTDIAWPGNPLGLPDEGGDDE